MTTTIEILPGVTLRCYPDHRFKQGCLSFSMIRPMCAEEAALNALIPAVLLRGTKNYPDLQTITWKLDDLYGASLSTQVRRVGDYQTCGLGLAMLVSMGLALTSIATTDDGFSNGFTQGYGGIWTMATAACADASVYYLNFKPEQDAQWQDLAKVYTEKTGVPVTVVTAASGQYETTLMSEMEKSECPTLFQVNGPVGLANWTDYCYDLSGTALMEHLTNEAFALK